MVDITNFNVIPTALFDYEKLSEDALTITSYNGVAENVTVPLEIDGLETKSISANAFFNKTSVISVNIPNTVEIIGDNCFSGCENLQKVTIPASVTEISETAFSGCADVTIHCYNGSYAQTYAEENHIPYILLDLVPVGKTVINTEAGIIFTQQSVKTSVDEIVKSDGYNIMAIPSYINGNTNYYGTGSTLYFFKDGALSFTYKLIVYGDLNGDSATDVIDASIAEKAVSEKNTLEEIYILASDFDSSGVITISDYQQVINLVLR